MSDSFMTQLIPLLMVFAIMYFLLIRPQQQKVKQHKLLIDAVRRQSVSLEPAAFDPTG